MFLNLGVKTILSKNQKMGQETFIEVT